MAIRFDNLVTETHGGVEIQINTHKLISITMKKGKRKFKYERRLQFAEKLYKNKYPFISKFYNPYSNHGFYSWENPTVIFSFGGTDCSWVTFYGGNDQAQEYFNHVKKKYFGNNGLQ